MNAISLWRLTFLTFVVFLTAGISMPAAAGPCAPGTSRAPGKKTGPCGPNIPSKATPRPGPAPAATVTRDGPPPTAPAPAASAPGPAQPQPLPPTPRFVVVPGDCLDSDDQTVLASGLPALVVPTCGRTIAVGGVAASVSFSSSASKRCEPRKQVINLK